MTRLQKLGTVATTAVILASQLQAAIVAPTLDSGDALIVGGAVLTGLAGIWGIKKAIGLLR